MVSKKVIKTVTKKPKKTKKASKKIKTSKTAYKSKEWDYPEPANTSGKRWPIEARMRDMKRLMESIGLKNVHKGDLAKKYGISRKILYEDIARIYKQGFSKEDVMHAKIDINKAMEFALNQASSLVLEASSIKNLAKGNNKLEAISSMVGAKSKALRALTTVIREKTHQMEKWGYKETVITDSETPVTIIFKTNDNKFPSVKYPNEKSSD